MKLLRLNQKGISHLLVPAAFVVVFAAIGGAVYLRSNALTTNTATQTYIYGHTYKGSSTTGTIAAKAHVPMLDLNTNTLRENNISDSLGYYRFSRIVVGHKYGLQAYKVIGCTEYKSDYVHITAKINNDRGNKLNLYMIHKVKLC